MPSHCCTPSCPLLRHASARRHLNHQGGKAGRTHVCFPFLLSAFALRFGRRSVPHGWLAIDLAPSPSYGNCERTARPVIFSASLSLHNFLIIKESMAGYSGIAVPMLTPTRLLFLSQPLHTQRRAHPSSRLPPRHHATTSREESPCTAFRGAFCASRVED
ncbi:hypothetical protein DFH11DRAFT_1600026 [Phellopilus nigrolimitatus]|nr:hypothetical protein DFH11DRAFT_1600026 [Phellopilus nigrolimitatus]